MKSIIWRLAGALILSMVASASAQYQQPEPAFVHLQPAEIRFEPASDNANVSYAVLFGDPATPGIYVMRIKVGAGITFPPHYHDQDRHVTVISGVWAFGTGRSGDCKDTIPMMAGSYALHPSGAVHFDGSCNEEPVEVQIIGTGPVGTFGIETD